MSLTDYLLNKATSKASELMKVLDMIALDGLDANKPNRPWFADVSADGIPNHEKLKVIWGELAGQLHALAASLPEGYHVVPDSETIENYIETLSNEYQAYLASEETADEESL